MIVRGSRSELEGKAASIIADAIEELFEDQPQVVLGVCGGTSVAGVFERLAKMSVEWPRVHLFMVDERLVPLGSEECNYNLVKEHLAGVLPAENLHPFVYDPKSPDKGTGKYGEELEALGGAFDIVVVSSGEDGHIGALYPDHHSIADPGEHFIVMDDSPKPPAARMSSSRSLLEQSQVGLVLFFGKGKREALNRFLDADTIVRQLPARLVLSLPQYYVLTDQEVGVDDGS